MTKILHIDPGEVITSIVDRLVSVKYKNIFLVIPSNAIFWHNIVNLRLLKREVNNLNKSITIVNSDRIKRELAERAGFQTINEIPRGALEDDVSGYKVEESLESMLLTQQQSKEPSGFTHGVFSKLKEYGGAPRKVSDIIRRPTKKIEAKQLERSPASVPLDTQIERDKEPEIFTEDSLPEQDEEISASIHKENGFTDDESGYPIITPQERVVSEEVGVEPEIKQIERSEFSRREEDENSGVYAPSFREKQDLEKEFFNKDSFEERLREDGHTEKQSGTSWYNVRNYIPRASGLFVIIFWLIIIVLVGGIFFIVLPKAELNIFRKTEKIVFGLDIIIDSGITSVDFDNNKIPGQILKVTNSSEKRFISSGERDAEDKARGRIKIYNELDSTSQPMIPSRFQEEKSGKIFWSTKSITVPGAQIKDGKIVSGTIEVDIVASEPGDNFNIDCSDSSPCNFTIPAWQGTVKFNKLYAVSTDPISGGSIGKVKVVTSDDIDKAEAEILSFLKDNARNSFLEKVPQDLSFLEESLQEKIISSGADVKVGDIASDFVYSSELEFSGFVFKESDIRSIIEYNIEKDLSEDKDLVNDSQEINFDVSYNDGGDAIVHVDGSQISVWKIDEEQIRKDVLRKDENELRKYFLNFNGIESGRVNFWPFWVDRVPNQESKIDIIISE